MTICTVFWDVPGTVFWDVPGTVFWDGYMGVLGRVYGCSGTGICMGWALAIPDGSCWVYHRTLPRVHPSPYPLPVHAPLKAAGPDLNA